jgi:threonine dehydratase
VTPDAVRAAAERIEGAVVRTPLTQSRTLSGITGADVWVKFENLQFTASYKERGALNKLLLIPPEQRAAGVVTASAGNFAQAVAYHARRLGITATIVMPVHTPNVKIEGTQALDAKVVLAGEGFDEANERAHQLEQDQGLLYLTPFDDVDVIAGQGTIGLEILQDAPDIEMIVAPVGGGGLLAGIAAFVRPTHPDVELIGVQSERYPTMAMALGRHDGPAGGPTIAEGIAVTHPGALCRELIATLADGIVVVPESRIEEAVSLLVDVEKTVAEGAGAAGLAALLHDPSRFRGRRVALVLTGGNIDLLLLASVLTRSMFRTRRLVAMTIDLPDTPGSLAALTALLGDVGVNIVDVEHRRHRLEVPTRVVQVTITVETRGPAHADGLAARLDAAGYRWEAALGPGHLG